MGGQIAIKSPWTTEHSGAMFYFTIRMPCCYFGDNEEIKPLCSIEDVADTQIEVVEPEQAVGAQDDDTISVATPLDLHTDLPLSPTDVPTKIKRSRSNFVATKLARARSR